MAEEDSAKKARAKRETNAHFARTNESFGDACRKVIFKNWTEGEYSLPPTKRQAGKWRRKMGLAWKMKNK